MWVNKKESSEEVSDERLNELVPVADELSDPVAVLKAGEESNPEGDELADLEGPYVDEVIDDPEVTKTELSVSADEMLYKIIR